VRQSVTLQRLMIFFLAVGMLYPAWLVLSGAARDVSRILKVLPSSGNWRGARFAVNEPFADYLEFLRAEVPWNGMVGLPPQEEARRNSNTGWALANTPLMQFFLAPRKVVNCTADQPGCASALAEKGAYLVVLGNAGFPHVETVALPENVHMFNDKWGVYHLSTGLPEPGESVPGNNLPVDRNEKTGLFSLKEVFWQLTQVGLWLLLLCMAGALLLFRWVPGIRSTTMLALGFGLSMGWLTISLFIVLSMGARISPGLVTALTLVWVFSSLVVFGLGRGRSSPREALSQFRKEIHGVHWLWYTVFMVLVGLAALLAVGKGYATSDEFFIWGAKGYGIVYDALPAGMSWGTQTTHYPLEVPLMVASVKSLSGDLVAQSKLIFPFFFAGLLVLMYDFLVGKMGPWIAGVTCLALAFSPAIFRHATLAYANLPLAFHLTAAVLLILYAKKAADNQQAWRLLLLSGIFLALAAWTRPEGLLLSLVVAGLAVVVLWKHWQSSHSRQRLGSRQMAAFLSALVGPLVIFSLIWFLWSGGFMGEHAPDARQETSLAAFVNAFQGFRAGFFHLVEARYLSGYLGQQLVTYRLWGVAGLGTLVLLLLGWTSGKPDRDVVFLLMCGGLIAGVIWLIYFILSYDRVHDVSWWVATGLNRMVLPAICLLWIGAVTWFFDLDKGALKVG
jgi:hypothetical protein